MPGTDYVAVLAAEGRRCADLLRTVPGEALLPHLPGWTVTDVGQHLAGDFVWATRTVRERRMPRAGIRPVPAAGTALADELDRLLDAMVEALRTCEADPDGPCPNFAEGAAGRLGWWPRHQTFETVLHRWDLEVPTGRHDPVAPGLAADGVDELLHVYTRRYRPHRLTVPLVLRCPGGQVPGWRVQPEGDDGRVRVERLGPTGRDEDAAGDVVTVTGDGAALLLTLWRRLDPADAGLSVQGDPQVLARFLSGPVTA